MHQLSQRCKVCGAENDFIRLTCSNCGAALRDRVPGLPLFATAAALLAEPSHTFTRIARSEQRNYVLTLFASTGPLLFSIALMTAETGDTGLHFGLLVLSYAVFAPVLGLAACFIAAFLQILLSPVMVSGKRAVKVQLSLNAWSLVPLAIAATIIVFVELAVFGSTLFSMEFHAIEYKPAVFWILSGIQAVLVLWSAALQFIALRLLGIRTGGAIGGVLTFFGGLAGATAAAGALLAWALPKLL